MGCNNVFSFAQRLAEENLLLINRMAQNNSSYVCPNGIHGYTINSPDSESIEKVVKLLISNMLAELELVLFQQIIASQDSGGLQNNEDDGDIYNAMIDWLKPSLGNTDIAALEF